MVVTKKQLGQRQRTINYDITSVEDAGPYRYSHKEVTMPPGVWYYDAIVAALVRAEYPGDHMEAIINNYLADQSDEHSQEMAQMQSWRTEAKNIARAALAECPEDAPVQNFTEPG